MDEEGSELWTELEDGHSVLAGHHGLGGGGRGVQDCAELTGHDGEGGFRGKAGMQVKPSLVLLPVAATCGGEGVQLARRRGDEKGLQEGQGGAQGWWKRVFLQPDHTHGHLG